MKCSPCDKEFIPFNYKGITLDKCSQCSALWFDKDELRKAKDAHDEFLRWIDPDIWKELGKFNVRISSKLCPREEVPLYETQYDDTGVIIDFCSICEGIRLDSGEFQKIVRNLKEQLSYESVAGYLKHIGEETLEVFSGKEGFREELGDLLIVIKLLVYRIEAKFPILIDITKNLPR